ncbi:hypothetical protein SEA_MASELOP_86 [Rhodococcus phage Maselop]|nr:hypothetical protein SEA_MASELOP_86 [Rhodococcus phage Maselop]WNM67469.1 hypothetical protein SEA_POLYYUKI_85 [Rhodococcus phage Polyyuki]
MSAIITRTPDAVTVSEFDAMRRDYRAALDASASGARTHHSARENVGDVYAALAIDLLDNGHGRHSRQWVALAAAFDGWVSDDDTEREAYALNRLADIATGSEPRRAVSLRKASDAPTLTREHVAGIGTGPVWVARDASGAALTF